MNKIFENVRLFIEVAWDMALDFGAWFRNDFLNVFWALFLFATIGLLIATMSLKARFEETAARANDLSERVKKLDVDQIKADIKDLKKDLGEIRQSRETQNAQLDEIEAAIKERIKERP